MQKNHFDENFAPFYRITQIIATPTDGNVLNHVFLERLWLLQKELESLRIKTYKVDTGFLGVAKGPPNGHDGHWISLNDFCLKPINDVCAIQSFTGWYQNEIDFFR